MNVFYEEEGALKVAAILADSATSLQVEAPHGKRSKIKAGAVMFRFEQPALGDFMDKRRILEIYLNVIEWGELVFGAEAAARYHFGVSAADLSPEQAARLAAMVPNPRKYGPGASTAYLQRRTTTLLARMNGARVP